MRTISAFWASRSACRRHGTARRRAAVRTRGVGVPQATTSPDQFDSQGRATGYGTRSSRMSPIRFCPGEASHWQISPMVDVSGSSTSMISATTGSTRSSWRRFWPRTRPGASRGIGLETVKRAPRRRRCSHARTIDKKVLPRPQNEHGWSTRVSPLVTGSKTDAPPHAPRTT